MALEKKQLLKAIYFPLTFLLIIWGVHSYVSIFQLELGYWGIGPRKLSGLPGIVFSPFIHGDWEHLYNNSLPLLVLGTALFLFFRQKAIQIWLALHFISGFWTWVTAAGGWHIGASGIVYGLAFFHFINGLISKNKNQMAFSLTVVFLYGGIIWGVLPDQKGISWEGHLGGALGGLLLGYLYSTKSKPSQPIQNKPIPDFSKLSSTGTISIKYQYSDKTPPTIP